MRRRPAHPLATLVGAALAACALGGCTTQPLVSAERPLDAGGRRIVLLLDASTSMIENDPEDVARTGVELALALAGPQDNVAVVAYARDADVVVPLQPAGDSARRAQLRGLLDAIDRNGVTNFAGGLATARSVLEAGDAPPGSAIVLLTDGVPYRERRRRLGGSVSDDLDEEVAAVAARGWRIFAIALSAEANTPFLTRMVAATQGAIVQALTPADLVAAFERVAVEAMGYLRAERGAEVQVEAYTRRLAFLGHFGGPGGSVGELTCDGQPVPPETVIRSPAAGAAPWSVALVDAPQAGRWAADLAGAAAEVTLFEPSFGLEFLEGKPPASVLAGQALPVGVRLVGIPEALATVESKLDLRARLELDGHVPGPWRRLMPVRDQERTFGHSFLAPRVSEETSLRLVVEASLTAGGRSFVLSRSRALTVDASAGGEPTGDLDVAVTPAQVTVVAWEDEPLPELTLAVRGDPAQGVTVSLAGSAEALTLAPGQTADLAVRCPEQSATLRLEVSGPDGEPQVVPVRVDVRRYRLAARSLELPATPAGVPTRLDGAPALVPPAALEVETGELRAAGPASAPLPWRWERGALTAEPPAAAAPGRYEARLRVRPAGTTLPAREVAVRLDVLPPPAGPELVRLTGRGGWVTQPVEVSWPARDPVAITIDPEPLEGRGLAARLSPELDIRCSPLDGWDGQRLGLDARRFALEVFVSSDLPAGVYAGQVRLRAGGRDLRIPVELEVRR